jgi:hypothetical protein
MLYIHVPTQIQAKKNFEPIVLATVRTCGSGSSLDD